MAINEKLQAYKESDEFKELLSKCNNKIDNAKLIIDAQDNNIDDIEEATKNDFNVANIKAKVFTFVLDNLNNKAANDLIVDIEDELKILKEYKYKALNGFGNPNSMLRYTKTDMLRFEVSYLQWVEWRLDALIWTEDIKVPDDIWAFEK